MFVNLSKEVYRVDRQTSTYLRLSFSFSHSNWNRNKGGVLRLINQADWVMRQVMMTSKTVEIGNKSKSGKEIKNNHFGSSFQWSYKSNSVQFICPRNSESKFQSRTLQAIDRGRQTDIDSHFFDFLKSKTRRTTKQRYTRKNKLQNIGDSKQTWAREMLSFTPRINSWIYKMVSTKLIQTFTNKKPKHAFQFLPQTNRYQFMTYRCTGWIEANKTSNKWKGQKKHTIEFNNQMCNTSTITGFSVSRALLASIPWEPIFLNSSFSLLYSTPPPNMQLHKI